MKLNIYIIGSVTFKEQQTDYIRVPEVKWAEKFLKDHLILIRM